MDQAKEKPKALLLQKPQGDAGSSAWGRVAKAISSFAELQIVESSEKISSAIEVGDAKLLLLDWSLVDWQNFSPPPEGVTALVVSDEEIQPTHPDAAAFRDRINSIPYLAAGDLSATDLARIFHLFFIPKRQPGVVPVIDKGAVIFGEKVQAPELIGSSLDRLATYLGQMESFALKDRIHDVHQTISGLLFAAFHQVKRGSSPYPTVDFQVGVSPKKLAVNMRFSKGGSSLEAIVKLIIEGTDVFWSHAWSIADFCFLTEHGMYNEIEVMLLFNRPQRPPYGSPRSLLHKVLLSSGKRENLLTAPQNFSFQSLSDVRLKKVEATSGNANEDEVSLGADFNSLPESVVEKLRAFKEKTDYLEEQLKTRETEKREVIERLTSTSADFNRKNLELVRLVKSNQLKAEKAEKRASDLEAKLSHASTPEGSASSTDSAADGTAGAALGRIGAGLKAMDSEKSQLSEKLALEQKRLAAAEAKLATLSKELTGKEKEISELKAVLIRMRKDQEKSDINGTFAKGLPAGAPSEGTKLKEAEAREMALKQEIKKLTFKVDNQEKNSKAIQNEAAEKAKLLEGKLQAAKTRELELLKKVEELSAALKKAAKAA